MIVNLNSKFRDSGSISDYKVNLDLPRNVCEFKLLEVDVPLSMFVINSNNIIPFIESSTPLITRTATISQGNYNSLDISTAISTAMNLSGTQTYTVTYDNITNYITISATSTFSLQFSNPSSLYYILGFPQTNTAFSTTFTSSSPINLSPSGVYVLSIQGLGLQTLIRSFKQAVSGHYPIFLKGNSYEWASWQNDIFDWIKCTYSGGTLGISLLYPDGSQVFLNSDWSVTFLLK